MEQGCVNSEKIKQVIHCQELAAMKLELESNRVILDELSGCYGVFLFTGGEVKRSPWGLVAIRSYLQRPFAIGRIGVGEVTRYWELAEAMMALGESVAMGRPRTLRARKNIARAFDCASAEIQSLGSALETAVTGVSQEVQQPIDRQQAAAQSAAGTPAVVAAADDHAATRQSNERPHDAVGT